MSEKECNNQESAQRAGGSPKTRGLPVTICTAETPPREATPVTVLASGKGYGKWAKRTAARCPQCIGVEKCTLVVRPKITR